MFRAALFVVLLVTVCAVRAQSNDTVSICVQSQDRYGRPCNGNGACVNETFANGTISEICLCDSDFGADDCSYKKHPQILVFLLDFFFGTLGVGRFIIGEVWQPILKLLLTVCGGCIACVIGAGNKVAGGIVGGLVGLGIFVWWLIDVCYFGMNKLADSNGYYLAPW